MRNNRLTAMCRTGCVLALLPLLALVGCEAGQDRAAEEYGADDGMSFAEATDRPPTPRTLQSMARILVSQGKHREASYVLARLIEAHPRVLSAYVELAELHALDRQYDRAREVLEAGLAEVPDDPVLLNNAGMCAMLGDRHLQALDYFIRAAAVAPDDARYRANLAAALGRLERYDEALALYRQVLPDAEAQYNIGVLSQINDDPDRAVAAFEQAERLGLTRTD